MHKSSKCIRNDEFARLVLHQVRAKEKERPNSTSCRCQIC